MPRAYSSARRSSASRVARVRGVNSLMLCLLLLGTARLAAADPPPALPEVMPGEGIETVSADLYRDAGIAALRSVLPPPPPLHTNNLRCPDPPKATDNELTQIAWLFVGLATAGMLLTTSWGVMQQKRAKLIREELSRIRIHRTSSIRANLSLGEVKMPPHGLGRAPAPAATAGPKVPLAPQASESVSSAALAAAVTAPPLPAAAAAAPAAATEDARRVRDQADARLATAQAGLAPLLSVARAAEEWLRSPEFEAIMSAAGPQRNFFDRVRRGLVAASATFHSLRDTRVFPQSSAAIEDEIERYWEQVYESLDDVNRLSSLYAGDEGRRAVAATPGSDKVGAQVERLLEAARDYLAGDGRRPIPIEPMHTDFDRRIHVAVDARKFPGVPANKVVSVVRCGIVRDGKLVRTPEVIQSL